MTIAVPEVKAVALAAHAAGLCVMPPKQDGSKRPIGEWTEYQLQRSSEKQIEDWYRNGRTGLGFVCGAVSENLECLDFDEHELYQSYKRRAADAGLDDLLERVEAGYCETTPNGDHLLYRCEAVDGNTKLARRPKRPAEMEDENDKVKTKIETRGEGGYIIVAPTHGAVNPGGAYRLIRGGVDTIATITAEERDALHALARTFDEMPRQVFREPVLRRANEALPDWEVRPGDDFNARVDWRDVLEPLGWKHIYRKGEVDHWAKPGKQHRGWSATTNHAGSDLLYVFSTATALDPERGYKKFSIYALLNHGGDFTAAARKLADDGYGKRADSSVSAVDSEDWPEPDPVSGPLPPPLLPLELLPAEVAAVASDVAERQQAPADFVVSSLLVSLAGLIGRGAGIRPRAFDDWTERPALWVANIGAPSSFKSPAQEEGTRSLRRQQERDHETYVREMVDWRADCAAAKQADPKHPDLPPPPVERRWWTADATVEKLALLSAPDVSRGLSVVRDELAGVILDMEKYHPRGGDRQFFLQAYTGGPYTVDRVTRDSLFVPDLLINLLGGIQPEVAQAVFGGGPDDGFSSRFLSIWPEPPSTWRRVDRWPDRGARQALDAVCDRLAVSNWSELLARDEFKPTPFCRLAIDGQALFNAWHEEVMMALRSGVYRGRLEGRVGKYPGLAARLILMFHLTEWAAGRGQQPSIVPAPIVANVLEFMDDYVLPMEKRVYGAYAVPADAEGGRRIARWLQTAQQRPPSFTAREIRRHEWTGLDDQAAVSAALEWLVSRNWLREAEPEKRPGRPSAVYLVNPRLEAGNG